MSKHKYFRDPIQGYIKVTDCALKIIDTPFFQRLRRINQLSFCNLVYHGAEHSRFGHSLGVYHLAQKISESLLENGDNIKEEFCLAALLHDIGHHPFSHSVERVLGTIYRDDSYDHEKYTINIIDRTEIGNIIEEYGYNKQNVIQILKGSYTKNKHLQYLNHLISSELDIDRLDYLLRDSYYCGVPYGKIDLERLFYSLEPKEDLLIISEKGLHAAEMYVLSRFYMYTQVYTHKTTRAFDLMLNLVLNKDIIEQSEYPKSNEDNLYKIIKYDDIWLNNIINKQAEDAAFDYKNIAKGIINREPIKCVIERVAFEERDSQKTDENYVTISNIQYNLDIISSEAKIKKEYVFIDEPWKDLPFEAKYHPYLSINGLEDEGNERTNAILINTKEGIKDIASIPNSISYRIARQEAKVVRIYTLKHYRRQLANAIKTRWTNLDDLIWEHKMVNEVPWNRWLDFLKIE